MATCHIEISAPIEEEEAENDNTQYENKQLENTQFQNTKLQNAKLQNAKLENTQLENAMFVEEKSKPDKKQAPQSPVKHRSAAIANRAAIFETAALSPTRSAKDPALMSVSERKALFEKNKGEALVPKVPFGMPVPAAKSKDKITEPKGSNTKIAGEEKEHQKCSAKKGVNVLRGAETATPKSSRTNEKDRANAADSPAKAAACQSGGIASKVAALLKNKSTISQSQIESSIKEQRQKEMDVLLNRFNKNKEVSFI